MRSGGTKTVGRVCCFGERMIAQLWLRLATKRPRRLLKPWGLGILAGALLLTDGQVWANYQLAQKKFRSKDYYEAAPLYYNAYTAPRSNSERLQAEWGLAQSLSNLGLQYAASKYYSIIVRRGRKASNPFFRKALEELGTINRQVSLGKSHIVKLFNTKVRASDVPRQARGFYFYYKGIEAFTAKQLEVAGDYFQKVPASSDYFVGALFHLGVVANLAGRHSKAIQRFQQVLRATEGQEEKRELYESAIMNLARVHYEQKRFPLAISFYGRIPRDSDHWLDAIWETSWAFFFLEKFNNTLGQIHTIHSPFFYNRFYPETYILQAITFLRLCRYDQVKASMRLFRDRYQNVFQAIKKMLGRYKGDPRGFYQLVSRYKNAGSLSKYEPAEEIVKKLTMVDSFKGARDTMRFASREMDALAGYSGAWQSSGLIAAIKTFLKGKKGTAVTGAGRDMYRLATTYYATLLGLSNQTKLIVAEMQLGKLASLRAKISAHKQKTSIQFIGGLQQLDINQTLEYWPFNQEYWEDELGFYVFNMASRCAKK